MADVNIESQTAVLIDLYLNYLLAEWRAVPRVATEWDTWQDYEQLDFVLKWPIREDRLMQLRHSDEHGDLSLVQRVRLTEMLQIVKRNRSILEDLLAN